jgi:16S rRNA (guanine1207-N2)-methyltransferase
MDDTRLATLFHPFETGLLDWPAEPALFLGAESGSRRRGAPASMVCIQGFRPQYLALQREGFAVRPTPEGHDYPASLVLCGRFRAENEARIAEALRRTRPGGLIVIGGSKTDGVASLRKRVGELSPIAGSASKYHGVVFWLERPTNAEAGRIAAALAPEPGLVEDRFVTGPGMFSADAVDRASRLLADCLPRDIGGNVADFCAGWGYLAVRLAEQQDVRRIDLYEASHEALEAAKLNLRGTAGAVEIGFHWHDLASEPVAARYDAIVMNPPFHQGRAAEPDLGVRMIGAAKAALKPGGRLFLVANRALPYERTLAGGFRAQSEIVSDSAYKVLWAVR